MLVVKPEAYILNFAPSKLLLGVGKGPNKRRQAESCSTLTNDCPLIRVCHWYSNVEELSMDCT